MHHRWRCLNHVVYIPNETYIQHLRLGSIVTSTSREKVLKHIGYSQKEIASNVVHGERIKETICWMYDFFQYCIDASDRPDYQYAYKVYYQEMSDGHHTHELCILLLCHYLTKIQVGPSLFKSCWNIRKRYVRMMRNWKILHRKFLFFQYWNNDIKQFSNTDCQEKYSRLTVN